ncbi:reverse transcriptase-like protein [Elysia marginata]|uniref:Reverse transcriptase-like protein n=1 Tax=Elysia marginata TaxID=1093978 RepID=A0AAV4EMK2_9GAST|nr:reverse transcriptase-like protein [Elysia marginata]
MRNCLKPAYLGVKLDKQLTVKKHVENTTTKAKKRLQLLKTLASSSWDSDKQTLRVLYLGYVRCAQNYGNSILTMCSQTTREIQNNVLRFLNGGMRSTPTAAYEILATWNPLKWTEKRHPWNCLKEAK